MRDDEERDVMRRQRQEFSGTVAGICFGICAGIVLWVFIGALWNMAWGNDVTQSQSQTQFQDNGTIIGGNTTATANGITGAEFSSDASNNNRIDLSMEEDASGVVALIGGASSYQAINSTADCVITGTTWKERGKSFLGFYSETAKQSIDSACWAEYVKQADHNRAMDVMRMEIERERIELERERMRQDEANRRLLYELEQMKE